jgi:hypothetical protein
MAIDLRYMPVNMLAERIEATWPKVNYAARPYLNAMHSLDTLRTQYGAERGASIVAYFLANAGTWRGEDARNIKAELNRRLDEYRKGW